jgi:predicted porin
MKYKLLPAAIAMASVFSSTAFADDLTVYGKANISLNSVDLESNGEDEWDLVSNASRLGVKGSHEINDNLKAIYKAEYEVYFDDGNKDGNTFSQRNIYVGLQGDFGTVIAGRHDTPVKLAQGKIDRFNDLQEGDIKNVIEGENRESNIVMYTTPNMSGFSATAAFIPGEETDGDDGIADGVSVSLNYKQDNLSLALANDSDVDGWDLTRAVAEYSIGDAKIGLLVQDGEEANGTEEQDGYVVSGEYKIEKWVLKAQYGTSDTEDGAAKSDIEQIAFGVDYKLSKKAKLYTYYSTVETDSTGTTTDDKVFAVGYQLKF